MRDCIEFVSEKVRRLTREVARQEAYRRVEREVAGRQAQVVRGVLYPSSGCVGVSTQRPPKGMG